MDISGMDPEQVFIGHVGGQLILAAKASDEALLKRILRGYLDVGGDSLELIAWLVKEVGAAYSLLAVATGEVEEGTWQEKLSMGLLDVEASLPPAVADEEGTQGDDQP